MRRFAAAVLFAPVALNPKLSFSLQSPHFFPNFVLPLLCFRRDLLSRKIEPRVSFFCFLFVIILYLYEAILLRENLISRREFFTCYNRSIMFLEDACFSKSSCLGEIYWAEEPLSRASSGCTAEGSKDILDSGERAATPVISSTNQ